MTMVFTAIRNTALNFLGKREDKTRYFELNLTLVNPKALVQQLLRQKDSELFALQDEVDEAQETIQSLSASSEEQTVALAKRRKTTGEYGERQWREAKKKLQR